MNNSYKHPVDIDATYDCYNSDVTLINTYRSWREYYHSGMGLNQLIYRQYPGEWEWDCGLYFAMIVGLYNEGQFYQ